MVSYKNCRRAGLEYRLSSLSEKYSNYIYRGYRCKVKDPIEEVDKALAAQHRIEKELDLAMDKEDALL
jgi:hypothetical protein